MRTQDGQHVLYVQDGMLRSTVGEDKQKEDSIETTSSSVSFDTDDVKDKDIIEDLENRYKELEERNGYLSRVVMGSLDGTDHSRLDELLRSQLNLESFINQHVFKVIDSVSTKVEKTQADVEDCHSGITALLEDFTVLSDDVYDTFDKLLDFLVKTGSNSTLSLKHHLLVTAVATSVTALLGSATVAFVVVRRTSVVPRPDAGLRATIINALLALGALSLVGLYVTLGPVNFAVTIAVALSTLVTLYHLRLDPSTLLTG